MSGASGGPVRRVLLAIDAVVRDAEAFEAASDVAARLGAELEALFVEDADLARLAALPFARELGLSSAARRPLQHADVERAWRREALRAQQALSQAAERHRVRWSFRVQRASPGAALIAAAAESDLVTVTLGRSAGARVQHRSMVAGVLGQLPCPLLVRPAGAVLQAPFVVLFDDEDSGRRALALAARLAGTGGERVVLIAASDPSRRERLRSEADRLAASLGGAALRVLGGAGLAAALPVLAGLPPGTLVLGAAGAQAAAATLERLAASGWVSVVVR